MMREIKFRAWNIYKKYMIQLKGWLGLSMQWLGSEPKDILYGEDGKHYARPEFKLMQYTGLKDKNGKEIYEGDVVKWDSDKGTVVWWNEDILQWRVSNGSILACISANKYNGWEIIGNIHENPELWEE